MNGGSDYALYSWSFNRDWLGKIPKTTAVELNLGVFRFLSPKERTIHKWKIV